MTADGRFDGAFEVTDAIFAAEQSFRKARETVDELGQLTRSALRALDEVELELHESAHRKHRLDIASDGLAGLNRRCLAIGEVSDELTTHLMRATAMLEHVDQLIDAIGVDTDPSVAQVLRQMRPRLAALADLVELARPMSQSLTRNTSSAGDLSSAAASTTLPGSPGLDAGPLERITRAGGQSLHRADEDVALMEAVIERAEASVIQTTTVVGEAVDLARHRPRQHHAPSDGAPRPPGTTGPRL